jgi:hypothetical protein
MNLLEYWVFKEALGWAFFAAFGVIALGIWIYWIWWKERKD